MASLTSILEASNIVIKKDPYLPDNIIFLYTSKEQSDLNASNPKFKTTHQNALSADFPAALESIIKVEPSKIQENVPTKSAQSNKSTVQISDLKDVIKKESTLATLESIIKIEPSQIQENVPIKNELVIEPNESTVRVCDLDSVDLTEKEPILPTFESIIKVKPRKIQEKVPIESELVNKGAPPNGFTAKTCDLNKVPEPFLDLIKKEPTSATLESIIKVEPSKIQGDVSIKNELVVKIIPLDIHLGATPNGSTIKRRDLEGMPKGPTLVSNTNSINKIPSNNLDSFVIKTKKVTGRSNLKRKTELENCDSTSVFKTLSLSKKSTYKWRVAPTEVILDSADHDVNVRLIKCAIRRGATIIDKVGMLKYQCPTCPLKCWSQQALKVHHNVHGFKLSNKLKCPECDYTTTADCTLNRHMEKHKKEPDLRCPHCPFMSKFSCSIRIHLRRWHLPDDEAKTWKCTECNFSSVSSTAYKEHRLVHLKGGNNLLSRHVCKSDVGPRDIEKCTYCRYEAPHKNALRVHMERTHKIIEAVSKELYYCKSCMFVTMYRHSLREHTLSFHKSLENSEIYICYNCSYETNSKKQLVAHMNNKHKKSSPIKEKPKYLCRICKRGLATKENLKKHMSIHSRNELFQCHDCGFTNKWKPVLKRHIVERHLTPKTKIYRCQNCDFSSSNREKYQKHKSEHRVGCDICGFKTRYKTTLENHIIDHMDKKRQAQLVNIYHCQECAYATWRKHRFERHLRRWKHEFVGCLNKGKWKIKRVRKQINASSVQKEMNVSN